MKLAEGYVIEVTYPGGQYLIDGGAGLCRVYGKQMAENVVRTHQKRDRAKLKCPYRPLTPEEMPTYRLLKVQLTEVPDR